MLLRRGERAFGGQGGGVRGDGGDGECPSWRDKPRPEQSVSPLITVGFLLDTPQREIVRQLAPAQRVVEHR